MTTYSDKWFQPPAPLAEVMLRNPDTGADLDNLEWGILGRNILNAVPILFDGPRLVWDELRRGH